MPDTAKSATAAADTPATDAPAAPAPPKRSPGHRGQDVRDTVAEMTAKAHEISLEAGSKMASAMREVVGAAAGLSAFTIESARDLVQYMVRRGQMTQDEADLLIQDAEEAWVKKHKGKLPPKADATKAQPAAAKSTAPAAKSAAPAAKAPAAKTAAKAASTKTAAKTVAKTATKAAASKATASKSAAKPATKSAAKK